MNQTILNNLSAPVNAVSSAYESRTGQLENKRAQEQKAISDADAKRDNDMLKVFEFAGDGRPDEAQFYAQQKGLNEIPPEIYANADMAKGLALSAKLYPDDSASAQKFTTSWMSTNGGDLESRVMAGSQAVGIPLNPEDRKFRQLLQMEKYKSDLKKSNFRGQVFLESQKASAGGVSPSATAGQDALTAYDKQFPEQQSIQMPQVGQSAGLTNSPPSVNNGLVDILALAKQRGANPEFANAIYGAETSFGANVKPSTAGAIGQMQTMPETLRDPGFGVQPAQNNSPQELARVGVDYSNAMLKRYNGDAEVAAIAYNAGYINADKFLASNRDYGVLPKREETEPYVQRVLSNMGQPQQASQQASPQALASNGTYAIQQLMAKGYTPEQIEANLMQRGASPEQARSLIQSAGKI